MSRLLAALAALAWLALAAAPASAHTRSETHSSWQVDGPVVRLQFTIPDQEAKRLAPLGEALPSTEALGDYVAERVGVAAKGQACQATPPAAVRATEGFQRYEFTFTCPTGEDLEVSSKVLVDRVPTHTNFAQVQTQDGRFFEQLMNAETTSLPVSGAAVENHLAKANFLDFIHMGVMHIFTGIDHMSFLVGLVLISRRFKDLAFVITGFTIGHSVTLALAVTGILRPHAEFIDALVALTIALIGAENISVSAHKPTVVALGAAALLIGMAGLKLLGVGTLPVLLLVGAALFVANYLMVSGHLRDAAKLRLVVTVVFGLVHGFGFAADLLDEKIPKERLVQLLTGFNIGVEIGQLSVVIGLALAVWLLSRLKLSLPRPIVVDVAASVLVCMGLYWFIQRSF